MEDSEWVLNVTWAVSAVIFGLLAPLCLGLAFLERPVPQQKGFDRTRQVYVCGALLFDAFALALRTIWFSFKSNESSRSLAVYVALGYISRTAECAQYGSVIIVSWQWALVCGRMLNWDRQLFQRTGYFILFLWLTFSAYYLGTSYFVYTQIRNEHKSKFTIEFLRFDNLAISCKCYLMFHLFSLAEYNIRFHLLCLPCKQCFLPFQLFPCWSSASRSMRRSTAG